MSEQRKLIGQYVGIYGEITKAKATELCSQFYYHNAAFHTGNILTRMVQQGILKRKKRGVYIRGNGVPVGRKNSQNKDSEQLELF